MSVEILKRHELEITQLIYRITKMEEGLIEIGDTVGKMVDNSNNIIKHIFGELSDSYENMDKRISKLEHKEIT